MKRKHTKTQLTNHIAFYRRLTTARYFEGMVEAILQHAGYTVYRWGQETVMPALRGTMHPAVSQPELTEERLRTCPDLLAQASAPRKGERRTMLVEVKYRSRSDNKTRISGIQFYKRYWQDVILVVISPVEPFFFAQWVAKLSARRQTFNLTNDFEPMDKLFPRVDKKTLATFAEDVLRFATAFSNNTHPSNLPEEHAGWSLLL